MKTATESGGAGNTFEAKHVEEVTPSSLLFQTTSVISTFDLFSPVMVPAAGPSKASFLECVRNQWSKALCAKPQATGLRRFGQICTQAPCTSQELHPTQYQRPPNRIRQRRPTNKMPESDHA
jgi:hypothetical protein